MRSTSMLQLLERVVDFAHARVGKLRPFNKMALVILALFAAHQHHTVVPAVERIGESK